MVANTYPKFYVIYNTGFTTRSKFLPDLHCVERFLDYMEIRGWKLISMENIEL